MYEPVQQVYASRYIRSAGLRGASTLLLAAKELDEERKDYELIREAAEGTKQIRGEREDADIVAASSKSSRFEPLSSEDSKIHSHSLVLPAS